MTGGISNQHRQEDLITSYGGKSAALRTSMFTAVAATPASSPAGNLATLVLNLTWWISLPDTAIVGLPFGMSKSERGDRLDARRLLRRNRCTEDGYGNGYLVCLSTTSSPLPK